MRPEPVTQGSSRSPREHCPLRSLRREETRMVRSTAIPLLILAGMALTQTEVGAASITYSIVNYPTLQNGYTVSGTITTNGDTGTTLPGTDITSWDISITKGTTTVVTLTPTDSFNLSNAFDATTTSITVATPFDTVEFVGPASLHEIDLSWTGLPGGGAVSYMAEDLSNNTNLWNASLFPVNSPIATVPEPSSAVLASIGAVAAFLAYGWSRHRRAQRRQATA
jgi:hypothetical protein